MRDGRAGGLWDCYARVAGIDSAWVTATEVVGPCGRHSPWACFWVLLRCELCAMAHCKGHRCLGWLAVVMVWQAHWGQSGGVRRGNCKTSLPAWDAFCMQQQAPFAWHGSMSQELWLVCYLPVFARHWSRCIQFNYFPATQCTPHLPGCWAHWACSAWAFLQPGLEDPCSLKMKS